MKFWLNIGNPEDAPTVNSKEEPPRPKDHELEKLLDRVKELEMELAQTKLALVETKCRNQELTHQIALHEEKQQESSQTSTYNLVGFRDGFFTQKFSICKKS